MSNKRKAIIGIIVLIFIILVALISVYLYNETNVRGLQYRIYNEDGWSKWYSSDQIAGEENKKITAIEIKIDSEKSGHIIYNTYSATDNFDNNDSYDGDTAGNKKDSLYGIKISLTDDLYNNYKVYYRTYNKKDKWLDWTTDYNISGNNEVNIEKIQIKMMNNNYEFNEKQEKNSIGF